MIDPADGDEGAIGDSRDLTDQAWGDGGPASLGGRGIHRTDGNVVDSLIDRGLRLLEGVRGAADQSSFKARQGANHLGWEIVLTQVNPVGIGSDRESRVIVD